MAVLYKRDKRDTVVPHLLPPDIVIPMVHRHKPPARVEVKHDLFKLLVVLGADVQAPRPAVWRDCHAHDQRLEVLLLYDAGAATAVGDPNVSEQPDERFDRFVDALPVVFDFHESAELVPQQ